MDAVDEFPDEVPPPKDSLREWREQILNWVLCGCAFFGSFAVIGEARLRLDDGRMEFAIVYVLIQALVVFAAFAHRLRFLPRALILIGALYLSAVGGFALG